MHFLEGASKWHHSEETEENEKVTIANHENRLTITKFSTVILSLCQISFLLQIS